MTTRITAFDPLEHVIKLIKGRVPIRRRNDLDGLKSYIVTNAIYQDLPADLYTSFSQHNRNNAYIHILNSTVTYF